MRITRLQTLAFCTALSMSAAVPALAQSPSAGNATTAPATHEKAMPKAESPAQRNAALTDRGEVRASKMIGAAVYNDRDEKVGSVDDIILGKDNTADAVVLSVGGFLGMGSKLVAVPYSDLRLGDTKNASSDNKVVMPGATKESLKGMPDFQYRNRG